MATMTEVLLAGTQKAGRKPAVLLLADGTRFDGWAAGAAGTTCGEVCFNTSMTGYVEVLTDPSYAGQIVCMTYPQIGNYGFCAGDAQRDVVHARALICHELCQHPSNWRQTQTLSEFLQNLGVIALEGIDTRKLTRHIRDAGAQLAIISTEEFESKVLLDKLSAHTGLVGVNNVAATSCEKPFIYPSDVLPYAHAFAYCPPQAQRKRVVAYDCGAKLGILENLVRVGCEVEVVPWDTPAEAVLAKQPDGVFLSNGPGDPTAVAPTYTQVEKLLGNVPVFGICLGHQMIGCACGAKIEKLKFGHRGGNHPVMNLLTHRVEVTSQNHGFGIVFESLGNLNPQESGGVARHPESLLEWVRCGQAPVVNNPRFGRIQLTHINLNDGTPEGIALLDVPAFSVQYHPEAQAGPTDSHYLFNAFMRLMEGRADYLDIDIAQDRLAGWKFAQDKEASNA